MQTTFLCGFCEKPFLPNDAAAVRYRLKQKGVVYCSKTCAFSKHGALKQYPREYSSWTSMKQRCNNPKNTHYARYGGRGIKCDASWERFENFLLDIGEKPDPEMEIERIDNDGNYCKENCRWATRKEQTRNRGGKRATRLYTFNDKTMCISDWAKENTDLMQQYKGIAGFFAPGGDSFSFEAFNRQIQKGERKRLTAEEMVAAAQYRIGASIYREKRNQLGATLNQEQRDWLSQWRGFLNEEYPGFPIKADFNPGEFPNFVNDLRTAVTDNRLADNDVANAVKEYLDARDQALAKAAEAGYSSFQSPKTQPLKDWLASIAATLVQQTPEFARIFEDKLAAEVD